MSNPAERAKKLTDELLEMATNVDEAAIVDDFDTAGGALFDLEQMIPRLSDVLDEAFDAQRES